MSNDYVIPQEAIDLYKKHTPTVAAQHTRDDLENIGTSFGRLTVKELKKRIENLPDDMPVCYQRIEDVYFSEHHWRTTIGNYRHEADSEYIPAFNCLTTMTTAGVEVLGICAHY